MGFRFALSRSHFAFFMLIQILVILQDLRGICKNWYTIKCHRFMKQRNITVISIILTSGILFSCNRKESLFTDTRLAPTCGALIETYSDELVSYSDIDSARVEEYWEYTRSNLENGDRYQGNHKSLYYTNMLCGDSVAYRELFSSAPVLRRSGVADNVIYYCSNISMALNGKVVTKMDYNESCYWFKTTYHVVIKELYWSTIDLKIGDTIVVKSSFSGYLGGCNEPADSSFIGTTHAPSFNVGDELNMSLSRGNYCRLLSIMKGSKYQDPFCTNSFSLMSLYKQFPVSFIPNLRSISKSLDYSYGH